MSSFLPALSRAPFLPNYAARSSHRVVRPAVTGFNSSVMLQPWCQHTWCWHVTMFIFVCLFVFVHVYRVLRALFRVPSRSSIHTRRRLLCKQVAPAIEHACMRVLLRTSCLAVPAGRVSLALPLTADGKGGRQACRSLHDEVHLSRMYKDSK